MHLPTQRSTHREASQNYGIAVQARAFESRELPTKQQRGELEIDMALGEESLDSRRVVASSEWTVLAIEIGGTSTAIERIATCSGHLLSEQLSYRSAT